MRLLGSGSRTIARGSRPHPRCIPESDRRSSYSDSHRGCPGFYMALFLVVVSALLVITRAFSHLGSPDGPVSGLLGASSWEPYNFVTMRSCQNQVFSA
jgi:hypothetical protein